MVWKPAPLFLYLPCTSLPAMVTSYTSPWSTSCMNLENEISASLFPVPPAFTTCHKSTPESRITSQKTIVLIGFDTQELPSWNAGGLQLRPLRTLLQRGGSRAHRGFSISSLRYPRSGCRTLRGFRRVRKGEAWASLVWILF